MSRSSAAALEVLEADYTSAFTEQLGGQRPLLLLEAPPVSDCGGAMNSKAGDANPIQRPSPTS
jgi:hypothetical protein